MSDRASTPAAWATEVVGERPSRLAPSGDTEIRLLPSLPRGELTHARCQAGAISKPGVVEGVTEAFYVLQGNGEIWRGDDAGDEVVDLRPGRAVLIPPAVGYQYRAARSGPVVFIVAVMPRWSPAHWRELEEGYWDDGGEPRRPLRSTPPSPAWETEDLVQIRITRRPTARRSGSYSSARRAA